MICTLTQVSNFVHLPWASTSHITVSGMVDTGTDITIISADRWPQSCPTTTVASVVAGLGGTTQSHLCSKPVLVKNPEGQTATIRPYVTATPLTLWRTDVSMGSLGRNRFLTGATVLRGVKQPTLALK